MDQIGKQIEESLKIIQSMVENKEIQGSINDAANLCISALKNGKKIMFAGNGGSAADAQHLAAELVNKFEYDRPALAAIALTTDTSVLTSVSNDYSFNKVFTRQIEALGSKGDVLIALSTSGNSANVIDSLKTAKEKGLTTIGLTGSSGGIMKDLCNVIIKVPSDHTPRIQEAHILTGHIICYLIETHLVSEKNTVD